MCTYIHLCEGKLFKASFSNDVQIVMILISLSTCVVYMVFAQNKPILGLQCLLVQLLVSFPELLNTFQFTLVLGLGSAPEVFSEKFHFDPYHSKTAILSSS